MLYHYHVANCLVKTPTGRLSPLLSLVLLECCNENTDWDPQKWNKFTKLYWSKFNTRMLCPTCAILPLRKKCCLRFEHYRETYVKILLSQSELNVFLKVYLNVPTSAKRHRSKWNIVRKKCIKFLYIHWKSVKSYNLLYVCIKILYFEYFTKINNMIYICNIMYTFLLHCFTGAEFCICRNRAQ